MDIRQMCQLRNSTIGWPGLSHLVPSSRLFPASAAPASPHPPLMPMGSLPAVTQGLGPSQLLTERSQMATQILSARLGGEHCSFMEPEFDLGGWVGKRGSERLSCQLCPILS